MVVVKREPRSYPVTMTNTIFAYVSGVAKT